MNAIVTRSLSTITRDRAAVGGLRRATRWAFAGLAALAGCGGPESVVSGTVTLDGVALQRGYVTFSPDASGGAGNASGQIQSGGAYAVQSGRSGGLPPGSYRVTVSSREKSKPSANGGPPAPGKLLTPARYAKASSSGLVVEVAPGRNVIDLKLESE